MYLCVLQHKYYSNIYEHFYFILKNYFTDFTQVHRPSLLSHSEVESVLGKKPIPPFIFTQNIVH